MGKGNVDMKGMYKKCIGTLERESVSDWYSRGKKI
jgi:hypothetical protein